ncbi:MAG: S-layer homology domain-containing protein [Butyricicoccus sp.]|nr:S-layer homology domain-containing protein [Butyricicoccus sp.]
MRKRLVAFVLTLAMMFTMMPFTASAASYVTTLVDSKSDLNGLALEMSKVNDNGMYAIKISAYDINFAGWKITLDYDSSVVKTCKSPNVAWGTTFHDVALLDPSMLNDEGLAIFGSIPNPPAINAEASFPVWAAQVQAIAEDSDTIEISGGVSQNFLTQYSGYYKTELYTSDPLSVKATSDGLELMTVYFQLQSGKEMDASTFSIDLKKARTATLFTDDVDVFPDSTELFISGFPEGTMEAQVATVELTAPAKVEVNAEKNGVDVELSAIAKEADDTVLNKEITYSIDDTDNTANATLNGNVLNIPGKADDDSIVTVVASCGGKTASKQITVTRAASVAAEINLSEEDVEIDGTAPKTVTASAKDQFDADMTPAWSVKPADQGVSIAADGTITIAANAKADDYEIYANGDEKSETLTVERTSTAKTVEVSGDTELTISDTKGADAEYTAEVKDYFNKTMKAEIEWSVADKEDEVAVSGVTINDDGELTVPYTAIAAGKTGVVIVTAKVNDTVFATHEVEITKEASKATTIELTGSEISGDTITVNGSDLTVGVTVKDQYGDSILNPEFTVNGATKTETGFTVDGKAADDAVITVTCGGASETLTVDRAASVPASVELSAESDEIKIGKSATYTATAKDQFGDDVAVEWSVSGGDGKVTVDQNGKVTVAADARDGAAEDEVVTVTVTATAGSFSDTLTINIIGKDKLTITEPSETTQTAAYDKTAKAFDPAGYTVETVNGTVFEKAPVITYTDAEGNDVAAPTNAGTYTVTLVWSDDDNYGSKTATLVIDPIELTVNAEAADRAYNGSKEVDVAVSLNNGVLAGDDVALAQTSPVVGTMENADAGEKKAVSLPELSLTGAAAGNYKLTQPTGVTVDIARKQIDVPAAKTGLVYKGEVQTGVPAGEGYSITGNTGTDAKGYTAVVTPDSNHCWSNGTYDQQNVNWSIAAKPVKVTAAAVEAKDFDNTNAATITSITFDDPALTASDYTATATFDSVNAAYSVEATVVVTVTNTNYTLTGDVPKAAAEIRRADYTVTMPVDSVSVKVGTDNLDFLPTVTVTDAVDGADPTGTVKWRIVETGDETDDLTAGWLQKQEVNAEGTYHTLVWGYNQTNSNFEYFKSGTIKLIIVEGDLQTITISGAPDGDVRYGYAPFELETSVTSDVAYPEGHKHTITWESSDETVATVDENGKVTIHKVGTANITATVAAVPGKYAADTDTVAVKVVARPIGVDVTEQTIQYGAALPTTWEYAKAEGYGLGYDDEMADLGVTITVESADDYEVGSYDVNIAITNTNYTLETETVADKLIVEQAAAPEFADKTATAFSKEVTAEDQELTVSLADVIAALGTDAAIKSVSAGIGSDANISAEADGSDVVITVKPTEAAEKAASFLATLSSKNYEDAVVEIIVSVVDKSDVSAKIDFEDKTVIWNGEAQKLDAAAFTGTAQGTGKFTYSADNGKTYTNAMPGFTTAGEHTVMVKYEDDKQIGFASATLTITNKLDVTVAVTDSEDATFANNGKYEVESVENAADENAAEASVKATSSLSAYLSTDAAQADAPHKWIGLLIGTSVNGETADDLYWSVDGENFEKIDASEFEAAKAHGGDGTQFVFWMATDVEEEVTRWIATDAEGSDALELNIDFTADRKPSSGSGSGSGSGTSGSISSSLDEKKAEKVEDMIDEIGRVTLEDEERIKDAREAYDDLTKKQKKLVDNYDKLVEAEERLEELLAAEELPFTDVDPDDDYYDAVKFVYDEGLMVGVGNGTLFAPEASLTRAMIARILHAYEGEPAAAASAFTDVARGLWYTSAIDWAAENGVISGYGNGMYGPNDVLTREQLAVILYYYAQSKGYDVSVGEDTNILSYADALSISSWAMPAMQWACAEDILTDVGGYIRATEPATRADVAEAFMAFMNLYE